MFTKEAMDLYENLLDKMGPEVQFFNSAEGNTKTADWKSEATEQILSKLRSGGSQLGDSATSIISKGIGDASINSPLLKTLGLAVPAVGAGAYGIGKWHASAQDDWDNLKYGLGGVGLGLLAPHLYKGLSGTGLGALANNEYDPSDFTSI